MFVFSVISRYKHLYIVQDLQPSKKLCIDYLIILDGIKNSENKFKTKKNIEKNIKKTGNI